MRSLLAPSLLLGLCVGSAGAQTAPPRDTTKATPLTEIVVTATRTPTRLFRTASPVVVMDSLRIHTTFANSAADFFRESPGLDITGTGPNQGRPIIRGQRGQRVLLLEDGIRLNNSRRQQDFGEIPALIGLESLRRIEVVRGPASVLYGTDAIGGVMNLITTRARRADGNSYIAGRASYRYSTSDAQQLPSGFVAGELGRFGFELSAAYRDADAYEAPAGRFGQLELGQDTKVHDTGVRDRTMAFQTSYRLGESHTLSARYARYSADDAGFGYVDNADLGLVDQPTVKIRYPEQTWDKLSLRYSANALSLPVADRMDLTGYTSGNERSLTLGVFVPFGPPTPAGAGVVVDSRNFTDIATTGFRLEAAKVIGRHVLTYGGDFFRDRSDNTDTSITTIVGFGPPQSTESDTATTPNASFRSAGLFAQGELSLTDRLTAVLGVRWQTVTAETRPTPKVTTPLVESTDNTVVGAANFLYRLTGHVNLIASVGRAFRSPNLIERFFNGPTPEGAGYQLRNPGLEPETSLDVDLGARVSAGRLFAEVFVFQNDVRHGIRIAPTGTKVGPFDGFQNVNVDRLRDRGIEAMAQLELGRGFAGGGSYTHLSSTNVSDDNPVGDSYSSKVTGWLGWREASGRFWAEYAVRVNGERKDVLLGDNPIGPVLPGFSVHSARAGARLFRIGRTTHGVTVAVNNLGNKLYAEFSNAGFFRPEPKRTLAASWTTTF